MPPSQIKVPLIKFLLGNLTNIQYNTARETLYCFIVNIGYYHLLYHDKPDHVQIWTIIFRILHTINLATIPDPGPAEVISWDVLMGAYHCFIACQ